MAWKGIVFAIWYTLIKKRGDIMGKGNYNEDVEIDIQKCATTDSTGLIPSLPVSKAEREAYQNISHYQTEAKKKAEPDIKK